MVGPEKRKPLYSGISSTNEMQCSRTKPTNRRGSPPTS
jgi:hypothetical protein